MALGPVKKGQEIVENFEKDAFNRGTTVKSTRLTFSKNQVEWKIKLYNPVKVCFYKPPTPS